jgi:hypothetical protein
MVTPVTDDDGGASVAPYTPSSVAAIKRVHGMLMEQLPRSMPWRPLDWLRGRRGESVAEASIDDSAAKALEQNIGAYLQRTIDNEESAADCDPLAWWKRAAPDFPCLAEFASRYLAVPATTAESERLFSLSGAVVSPMRTRLSPERVNQLVTTRAYYLTSERATRKEVEEQEAESRGLGAAMVEDGDACVDDDGYVTLEPTHDEDLDTYAPCPC